MPLNLFGRSLLTTLEYGLRYFISLKNVYKEGTRPGKFFRRFKILLYI